MSSASVFADHRGHGRSDKPHDVSSYALTTRVADAVAVLDELGIGRAHYLGFSWRLDSGSRSVRRAGSGAVLVLCGNQPHVALTGRCSVGSATR